MACLVLTMVGFTADVEALATAIDVLAEHAQTAEIFTPRQGEQVRVGLDKGGFVRTVGPVPSPRGEPDFEDDLPFEPARDRDGEPDPRVFDWDAESKAQADGKDLRITRLACLNTSTAILSSGNRAVEPKAAVKLAELLEAWVLR